MHPSVATACNDLKSIHSQADVENLCDEFQSKNLYESILEHHNRSRTALSDGIISSKVRIVSVNNCFVQIVPIEWD